MSITIRSSVAALAVFVVASAPAADPPTDDELRAFVDEIAANVVEQPGAVGLSIGVARGGIVIVDQGYGLAEVEHGVPADAHTLFRIGSVTKQFTAAAIMKLVEDGKLTLDDTADTWFPEYPFGGRTVTVRHLLTHTSGIPSYTGIEEFWKTGATRELTVQELLDYVKDEPFDFDPGEQWNYNNTAYYMLGPIVEQASGQTYADYLQTKFFAPLGLERTRYDSNRAVIMNRAQGYDVDEESGALLNDLIIGMDNPGAAGGILSTGGDLVRWQMALNDARVVTKDSYAQMITPTVLPDGTDTGYGFGLGIRDRQGKRVISHGGGIHGFNSMLEYHPAAGPDENDLHIAVISNGAVNSGQLARRIAQSAFGEEEKPVADLAIEPEYAAQCAGTFHFEDPNIDLTVNVTVENGQLMVSPEGQGTFRLMYQGDREFRASFDPSAKVIYDEDPATGFTLHQGGAIVHAKRVEEEWRSRAHPPSGQRSSGARMPRSGMARLISARSGPGEVQMKKPRILTIGVYGFSEDDFFDALTEAKIDLFCDVRARRGLRGSQYAFANSAYLQDKIAALGIRYAHRPELSPSESTRRAQEQADKDAGIARRARTELTSRFVTAYRNERLNDFDAKALVTELDAKSIVFFCVEQFPAACHRSLLAEQIGTQLGVKVEHLVP